MQQAHETNNYNKLETFLDSFEVKIGKQLLRQEELIVKQNEMFNQKFIKLENQIMQQNEKIVAQNEKISELKPLSFSKHLGLFATQSAIVLTAVFGSIALMMKIFPH